MKLPVSCIILLLLSALAVSGCMNQQPAAPAPVPSQTPELPITTTAPVLPQSMSGTWILTTFGIEGGTTITRPSSEISLTLNPDGSLSGFGGCNNYFGSFVLTGSETEKGAGMTVRDLGSTKKYCQSESEEEQQYLAILQRTSACSGDATTFLTLTAKNGDSLGFRRPGAAPVGIIGQI